MSAANEARAVGHASVRLAPVRATLELASQHGGSALFGDDWQPVMDVVAQGLPPYGVPDVNTEVPLVGKPGSDVHVRCSERHFHGRGAPEAGSFWEEHPSFLAWCTSKLGPGEGIGLSYDVRKPQHDVPAVYYRGPSVGGFFLSLGVPQAAAVFRCARERLPKGWRCWYTGTFPNRVGSPVRLGVVVSRPTQDGYVSRSQTLADDFASVGICGIDAAMLDFLSEQAAQPYVFDIELDVMDDGSMGDVVGVNLTVEKSGKSVRDAIATGGLGRALRRAEEAGLADRRWTMLGEATFARLAPSPLGGRGGLVACANQLVYVKLRLKQGKAHDVKAYFQTNWRAL